MSEEGDQQYFGEWKRDLAERMKAYDVQLRLSRDYILENRTRDEFALQSLARIDERIVSNYERVNKLERKIESLEAQIKIVIPIAAFFASALISIGMSFFT